MITSVLMKLHCFANKLEPRHTVDENVEKLCMIVCTEWIRELYCIHENVKEIGGNGEESPQKKVRNMVDVS